MRRAIVLFGVLFGLAASCNGFREDEIACERAVVHLKDCCPDFHSSAVDCSYSDATDCGGHIVSEKLPELSITESRRIEAMSCGDLVSGKQCDRGAVHVKVNP
jgi:hypothetical protein